MNIQDMNPEEINEAIEHQKQLLRALHKRLQQRELQEAQQGLNTPPEIITEISSLKKRIHSQETELKRLQSSEVEDQISEETLPVAGTATVLSGIVPPIQVHGYSGEWAIENKFERWKGHLLKEMNATVYFHGKAFILLSVDGQRGSGTQIGKLYISVDNYEAIYENSNRINRAYITEDGTLHLDVEVLLRTRLKEDGEPPEAFFREDLFGSKEFELDLRPVPGEPKTLKGKHVYKTGNEPYQEANEVYTYLGF